MASPFTTEFARIKELEAENARLKEELARSKRQSANRLIGLCKCGEERDAIEGQLSAAQKDAERYRWLRDIGNATWRPFDLRDGCSAEIIDAAIDAAIAAEKGEQK